MFLTLLAVLFIGSTTSFSFASGSSNYKKKPKKPRPTAPGEIYKFPGPCKLRDKKFKELRNQIESPKGKDPERCRYYSSSKVEKNYKIVLPVNRRIRLTFREVDLERRGRDNQCDKEYIKVYDGIASRSRIMWTLCGNEHVNEPIISKTNKLRIKFVGYIVNGKGFNATYQPATVTNTIMTWKRKVIGIVIGTPSGLVFLALIYYYRRRRSDIQSNYGPGAGRHYIQSNYGPDTIQEEAPPSFDHENLDENNESVEEDSFDPAGSSSHMVNMECKQDMGNNKDEAQDKVNTMSTGVDTDSSNSVISVQSVSPANHEEVPAHQQ